jgi:hypothetical protein
MQSVRLKTSLISPRSAQSRLFLFSLSAFLVAVGLSAAAVPCRAQTDSTVKTEAESKEKFDVGVGGFYQITNASNGNFVRDDTTSSGGGLASFRQPWKPWIGYEANAGYTKFFESYNKNTIKVQSNVTDVSVAYLLQAPPISGVQLFATLGGGLIVFAPIQGSILNIVANPNQPFKLSSQFLPEFVYSVGLNYPVYGRFGVRGQLRGLEYKTPNFHQGAIDTKTLRGTVEPTLSVYYRF